MYTANAMLSHKKHKMTPATKEASLEAEERRHERDVERGLSTIYRDEKGDMPDLSSFDPIVSRWRRYVFIGVLIAIALLVAAAWAGFSVFRPFRGFSGQALVLSIEGPEKVSLGQETTYFVNYRNETAEPIAAADLRLSFPSDFTVSSFEPPATSEGRVWKIGSVPVDGHGTIKVKGVFTGALGTVTAIQVVGTYRPASFNSEFEALATKSLNYSDSVLQGMLFVPAKVLPGDRTNIAYAIRNTGTDALRDLVIRVTVPEGFVIDSASSVKVMIEGRVMQFQLGSLAANASTTASVRGAFASGVSGEAHVIAEVGRLNAEGMFLPAQHTETSFSVLAGDLSLKLVMNGQDVDTSIHYGDALHFSIGYENTAAEDLQDVQLRFHVEAVTTTNKVPFLVDWSRMEDSAHGVRRDQDIRWTKEQIIALGRLPSHEDGSIDVALQALPSASGTAGLAVRAYVEATIGSVGGTAVHRVVRSSPLLIRYLSDAHLSAEARYYSEEGVPLGTGPLPPLVGQTTTYRIRWDLDKTFGELKDMTVKATIPKNVTWKGSVQVGAGELLYDASTRSVRWNLNRVPEHVNETAVEFSVSLTPTESDANRFAQLTGPTELQAVDATQNASVSQTVSALTTDLEHDENAKAKGVVRRP